MDYSSEGLTDKLQYSDRVKIAADKRKSIRDKECSENPRKYKISDIKNGQLVIRRWCGNKNDKSILMQTIKIGF